MFPRYCTPPIRLGWKCRDVRCLLSLCVQLLKASTQRVHGGAPVWICVYVCSYVLWSIIHVNFITAHRACGVSCVATPVPRSPSRRRAPGRLDSTRPDGGPAEMWSGRTSRLVVPSRLARPSRVASRVDAVGRGVQDDLSERSRSTFVFISCHHGAHGRVILPPVKQVFSIPSPYADAVVCAMHIYLS
jgi:hypothetical protein